MDELSRVGALFGKKVITPIGTGVLVSMIMPHNGLYCTPTQTQCLVWFGTDNAANGFVSHSFDPCDIVESR